MRAVIGRQPLFAPPVLEDVVQEPLTISAWIEREGVEWDLPVVCTVDGRPVLRRDWDWLPVSEGQVVVFVEIVQGGGGGGSNTMQIVGMIALAALAWYAAPIIGGWVGSAAMSGMWFGSAGAAVTFGSIVQGLAAAAIMTGGSLLINAMVGTPKVPSMQTPEAASSVYSVDAQGNSANLLGVIPEVFGRHLIVPDWAAQPYAEYSGNEQYVSMLYCLGRGQYEIEEMRLEDTPLTSFPEVETQIVQPGQPVTLFPDNVVTSGEVSGQELSVTPTGPFTINGSGTSANYIGVDLVATKGIGRMRDDGKLVSLSVSIEIQARRINDSGIPSGEWVALATETIAGATLTPQRLTYRYGVTPGRYQVRVFRSSSANTDTTHYLDVIAWAGCRAYLPSARLYGDVTMVALRIRASNSISSQTSRQFKVVVTRKLPPLRGGETLTATRSIARALAYMCRERGIAESRIDYDRLESLDATWTERGDYLDGVFDTKQSFWEALTQACRVGRAVPIALGGLLTVVRDEPVSVYKAVITPREIRPNSLSVDYVFADADSPDYVTVQFFNRETWSWDEVDCILPGVEATKPATVKYWGITVRSHAYREGMHAAAQNAFRRKFVTLSSVDLAGMIPTYGDLVAVSHDMPAWGVSGEVLAVDGLTLRLSEPVEWVEGETHYVGLRRADGSMAGPYAVTPGADERHIVLSEEPGFEIYAGRQRDRTAFMFGPGVRFMQPCRVLGCTPRGGEEVELYLVNEAEAVHTADEGEAPAPPIYSSLPTIPAGPVVGDLFVRQEGAGSDPVLNIAWFPAAGADRYVIQTSVDGDTWAAWGDTTQSSASVSVAPGTAYVRVAGVGRVLGPWSGWSGAAVGASREPANASGMVLRQPYANGDAFVRWEPSTLASYYEVSVWQGGAMRYDAAVAVPQFDFPSSLAANYGGPWRSFEIRIRAVNSSGPSGWSSLAISDPAPAAPFGLVVIEADPDPEAGLTRHLSWTAPADADVASCAVQKQSGESWAPFATAALGTTTIDIGPEEATYRVGYADTFGGPEHWATVVAPDVTPEGGGS